MVRRVHSLPVTMATHEPPTRRRRRPNEGLAIGTRVCWWRVDAELGRGGMATVHAVTHAKFGKRAAIKIAHRDILGEYVSHRTFLREARIVHRVAHPAVIDVFATGSCDGRPYLVMERLSGTPLGRRLDAGPPLTASDSLGILIELCDVLRAAHAVGVVHRDLKLDNVFLTTSAFGDGCHVKLLDWGVAHVVDEHDPFRGLIAGTLTYVAPEQIRGDRMTAAADIYSLAVLAYHLLCHRAPFAATSDLALIQLHLRGQPPPPSHEWPEIPSELEQLLLHMLAKDPSKRPTLIEVERVRRAARDELDAPMRFAEGSQAEITIEDAELVELIACEDRAWYTRWLAARWLSPRLADPWRRLIVPSAPFGLGWVMIATAVIALAVLLALSA